MNWLKNTTAFTLSIATTLLLLEGLLRLLPVLEVTRDGTVVANAKPFEIRGPIDASVTQSHLWNFQNAQTRKTNAMGYFADENFAKDAASILAIGDSFVEAMQVSYEDTFHQLLAQSTALPVYNIALSGAPLSQYDAWLQQACNELNPEAAIFTIISNDFDESLYASRAADGFFHYHGISGPLLATPYRQSLLRRIAESSSVVRYLFFNLGVGSMLASRDSENDTAAVNETDIANKENSATTMQVSDNNIQLQQLVNRFLDSVSTQCIPANRLIFIVDADRYEDPARSIYQGNAQRAPYFKTFITQARQRDLTVIDLQGPMLNRYQETGQQFEFTFDEHWNKAAHQLVAKEIVKLEFLRAP